MQAGMIAVAVGLLAGVAVAADTPAPIPKEGRVSGFNAFSGSAKTLPLGKDRIQFTSESMGVVISDTGEGILHHASIRCLGGGHLVNGELDNESGSCALTRLDGDQVFIVYKGAGKPGVAPKGTFTFVGGTGRLANIQGAGEYTAIRLRPAAEGTGQHITRWMATYKVP